MSLSWRKRQALASDQKTWRGLGLDSALWKSIDRNAANVATSLGSGGTTGIVTGLTFVKTEGLSFDGTSGTGEKKIYVSDASNSTVVSQSGVNQFDTPHPPSNSGNGLVFTYKKYDSASRFIENPTNTDISGIKYDIVNGGSGYNVGDLITLNGSQRLGLKIEVTTVNPTVSLTDDIEGGLLGTPFPVITQDPYRITDVSVNVTTIIAPANGVDGGNIVTLHNGPLLEAGTLTGKLAPQSYNFSVIDTNGTATGTSFTTNDFSTAADTAGVLTGGTFAGFDFSLATAGTLTGDTFAVRDFSTLGSEDLILTVDGGSPATITIDSNATDAAAVVTAHGAAFTAAGATLSDSGSNTLIITSNTTGASSSISLTGTTDTNALALFGNQTIVAGAANSNENLTVEINGTSHTVTLTANCLLIANARTHLDGLVTGLTPVSATVSNTTVLIITSDVAGSSSSINLISASSGTNALELFNNVVSGVDGTAAQEILKIQVDGGVTQNITLNTDITNITDAVNALSGLVGATASNVGGNLRITSNGATGPSSTIALPSGSGTAASALIGSASIVNGTSDTSETLKITIDGGIEKSLVINDNVTNISDAVTAVTAGAIPTLSTIGASAADDGSGKLKITSNTTGSSSSVSINTTGTGANVLKLFGNAGLYNPPFTTLVGTDEAPVIATGFLASSPGTSNTGFTKLRIHSKTGPSGDFTSGPTNQSIKVSGGSYIGNNGDDVGTKVTNGGITLISTEPGATGFTDSIQNGVSAFNLYQASLADTVNNTFVAAYSPLKNGDVVVLNEARARSMSVAATATTLTSVGTPISPIVGNVGDGQFNGRITVKVSHVANTNPQPGRN